VTVSPPLARVRRFSRPGIYDHGVIGNLRTAALVSRFGAVDWACLPRFASPSVFADLLDRRRGGAFTVAPAEGGESEQTYLPSSNVLLTRFFLSGDRQLDLVDFMPIGPSPPDPVPATIVRIVEARGGAIKVRFSIQPRFQYGLESAAWTPENGGFVARGTVDALWESGSAPLAVRDGRLEGTAELAPGERCDVAVGWGSDRPDAPSADELLLGTTRFWQGWVHPPTTPIHRIAGLWHAWVERSELLLKLCSNESTGAFVAAPTTSLPEWPGGSRNWDYRYVWIRDAAFSAQALLLLGHLVEAERFLDWTMGRIVEREGTARLRVMYPADGDGDLRERELPHLEGFARSRPVRVGNVAEQQFQLDIYGELLDAARLLAARRPGAVAPHWPRLVRLTDEVAACWRAPDHGIWEVRDRPRPYVHSKLMAWVAVDRAIDLARRFQDAPSEERWTPVRDAIRAWILDEGFDPGTTSFVQAAGASEIDAANLRIPIVGFLPFDDPRVRGTVERVRRELGRGPFVYRYRASDGLGGPEGSFLPAAFWLVECLARMGARRRAAANFRRLLLAASPLGLFPEEFDPGRRRPLGNFPQAFTHIGVLRAAVALGAAEMPSFLAPPVAR
jgi:GH15 family glucan-1,4-alpha-glucosidase